MSKELLVSSTPHETRVGLVEDDQLAEIYLERENEYTLAGSIYKGRVTRVLPGMQSAFVDIGLERDAFLYVSDFMEVGDQDDTEEIPITRSVSIEQPSHPEAAPQQREPVYAEEPEETEEAGSALAAGETNEAPENGDSGRSDKDGDGRGGKWRGRRRRRGRRGERLPETRFAPPAPVAAAPAPTPTPIAHEEPEYGPPAGYQPILLPGESISKYQRASQSSTANPPATSAAEIAQSPAKQGIRQTETASPEHASSETFSIEGGHEEQSKQEHSPESQHAADIPGLEPSTPSERERDHEDEQLDPEDVRHATTPEEPQDGTVPQVAAAEHEVEEHDEHGQDEPSQVEQVHDDYQDQHDGTNEFASSRQREPEEDRRSAPLSNESSSFYASSGVMEEEEIDEDEADLAAYVEDLEEEATFDEMEEETRAAEDYHAMNAAERPATERQAGPRVVAEFGFNGHGDEADEEDDVESEIEQAQSEAEALLAGEAVDNGTGDARVEVRGPSTSAGYTQRTQRSGSGRFDRRGRGGRRTGGGGGGGGGRRFPRRNDVHQMPQITELLKEGQEILVQIAKEPIGKKGARITSHIALPGRFLVFMPTVNHTGVSRKIASEEERQRLKRIIMSERENGHGGFIVRTAAQGAAEEELRADIRFLKGLWAEIRTRADNGRSPALIYHDLNVVERVLRDQVTSDFSAIWVDTESEYERILRFANRFQPALVRRVKLYTKETPLYDQFGLNEEINKALKSKVWLKSGGYIVINQTEALVAIDVNTGKYVGKTARLEDTIVKTNVDAIKEIVRQIRLRDLGGIIVIDFIDMDERRNRQKVMQALEEELRNDRAPSKVLQFNDFGLVAITRKRVKQSLERTLGSPCPYCIGTGYVKSVQSVCNEIYVEMRKLLRQLDHPDVMLRVNPEVAKQLKANNARALTEMEEMVRKTIIVKSDPALHQEQFDIT